MEETPSRHRNLQHLLSAGVKERAFQLLGEGSDAGRKVLELRQRDMQELFGRIFGVPTKSSNNEWLRSKLLQAVGLPPRWRPAPAAPPSPRWDARPGEFSRFGRRLRTPVAPAMTAADEGSDSEPETRDEEEEQRPRKRSRAARPSGSAGSGSVSSRGASARAASAGATTSSGGSAAILALQERAATGSVGAPTVQERAAAAFVGAPAWQEQMPPPASLSPHTRLAAQPYAQPQAAMPLAAQPHSPHQPGWPLAAQQYWQPQPTMPLAALQPAPVGALRSVRVPVPPQCAPGRSNALAALLSDPSAAPPSPNLLPAAPHVTSLLAIPSMKLGSSNLHSCTISAQLHTLYTDWEDGLVSFGPM
ncbi:hypothetical protein ABPG77_006610 [Micractinium sp. CCAP 211/92]